MTSDKKMTIEKLNIVEFTDEGSGLSYLERNDISYPVEVPFTMPGDVVLARILKKRGGVYSSLLEEVVEQSPERVTPRCKHFGRCGGCRRQHVAYEKQLELKEAFVRKCFEGILPASFSFNPIVACDPPWIYRNKMEFSFSSNLDGKKFLGMILQGSRGRVFNLEECFLVNTWYSDVVKAVREWWELSGLDAYYPPKDHGSLRTLTVREGMRTGDRMVFLTVSGNPDFAMNKAQIDSYVAAVRQAVEPANETSFLSIFIRIQQTAKGRKTNFYEMHLYGPDHIREELTIQLDPSGTPYKLSFTISPTAFFQPNTAQAEKLYSTALQLAKVPHNSIIYDLYCGTGTLGICAAQVSKEVIGIELSPESALDARTNVTKNGLNQVSIHTGDVGKVLEKLKEDNQLPHPDLVMVDPPRMGLDPCAVQNLLALKTPKILYISCNPKTQAQNIKDLCRGGYQVEVVQPVDQFPQTVHIENIVVLTLEK